MAVPVSACGLIFGSRSLSGSPIGGIPETQEISSRKGRFYAAPESARKRKLRARFGVKRDKAIDSEFSSYSARACSVSAMADMISGIAIPASSR
jgi:hypothetical protein